MSWIDFNEEYLMDALMERSIYYAESEKAGVHKDGYYLRDHLQIPFITEKLAKGKVRDSIVEFVAQFMNDHTTQLGTVGPVHIFTFADKETSFFYDLFGLTKEKIIELYDQTVQETYYGNISSIYTGWIKNAPHKLLFTAMLIESLQKDYEDMIECCEYLWAFTEYPLVYRIFWKTGVKEDLMQYTIEHLGNKFKIKEMNNLQEFLKYDVHTSVLSHADRLKTGADNEYMDFIYRIRNQMKNKFKNISREYYKNDKNNATQHIRDSTFDDGTLADQEGFMTSMSLIIDNTVSKFSTAGVNNALAKVAADRYQVDKDNLVSFINQIWRNKNNRMYKFVEDIITAYFEKNPMTISLSSMEFVDFGIMLYRSIGTSKNPLYMEIKAILNLWMNEIINIRQYYSRDATVSNYSSAIFNYVILLINHYN